jgi:amino acid transporter
MKRAVQEEPLAPQGGLKRECLSFSQVVAQSVASIAPVATPTLIIPLVFANGQNGTWLAYLLASIAMLLVTYHVNQFARRGASSGALYTFAGRGLGPTWGVIAGWSLVLAYLFTGSACLAGAANYSLRLAHLFSAQFDFAVTVVSMLGVAGISWWLAYHDIRLSTRAMLLLEFTSVALILVLAASFFLKTGRFVDHAQLSLAGSNAKGIRLGLVLAMFSFVGFESATALGHEAKEPLRSIPWAMSVSVAAVGAFFVLMSYVLVMVFRGQASALDKSDAPLTFIANATGMASFGIAIAAGVVMSQIACSLACINAAARVVYSMSRHGFLHASTASTHKTNATPHVAVTISSVFIAAVPIFLFLRHVALLDIFGYLGTLATFGFLFSYILIVLAAPIFLRQRNELKAAPAILSIAALVMLALPLVASFDPAPAPPNNYLPYIFFALLMLGVARFAYLRITRPEILREMEEDMGLTRFGRGSAGDPAPRSHQGA